MGAWAGRVTRSELHWAGSATIRSATGTSPVVRTSSSPRASTGSRPRLPSRGRARGLSLGHLRNDPFAPTREVSDSVSHWLGRLFTHRCCFCSTSRRRASTRRVFDAFVMLCARRRRGERWCLSLRTMRALLRMAMFASSSTVDESRTVRERAVPSVARFRCRGAAGDREGRERIAAVRSGWRPLPAAYCWGAEYGCIVRYVRVARGLEVRGPCFGSVAMTSKGQRPLPRTSSRTTPLKGGARPSPRPVTAPAF